MWTDEIVEQVRAEREKLAVKHGHDLKALFHALQEREKASRGREIASLPSREAIESSETAA